jgi:hypothetical protein
MDILFLAPYSHCYATIYFSAPRSSFHPAHLSCKPLHAQPVVSSLKERSVVEDDLLRDRLDNLLPRLMRQEGLDMWVIVAREYNEDPVARTMLPGTWLHARRRTILVFTDKGGSEGVERLAVARYDIGNLFKGAWEPERESNQWKRLAAIIAERSPKKIGLNISRVCSCRRTDKS